MMKMMHALSRRFAVLRNDQRGTTIIELAMIAPVFGLLVVGIVDVSRGYSAKLQLEQAAYRTLEMAVLARDDGNWDYLRTEAALAARVPESQVALDNWLECNGSRQTVYASVCPSGQTSARYLRLTINSSFRPTFTSGPYTTVNGVVPIRVTTAVRVQ